MWTYLVQEYLAFFESFSYDEPVLLNTLRHVKPV